MVLRFITLFLGLILSGSANAVLITSSIGAYEVTSTTTTFSASSTLLQSQPWWDSQTLADEFATLVNDQLGFPNPYTGPAFAYVIDGISVATKAWGSLPPTDIAQDLFLHAEFPFSYAISTRIDSVSEPDVLSLYGAAALGLFAFVRRRQLLRTRLI